ncbi:MAG: transporter [Gemmatimonadaceae bacterium]
MLTTIDSVRVAARSSASAAQFATGVVFAFVMPIVASAQTDYYNTDSRRPITIEDAYATERYAFELQLAPLRLERSRGGIYNWAVEPELAYGILPRTHVELGFPIAYMDLGASRRRAGLAGIEVSFLHNLNVETRTLPAFGLVGDMLAPVGGLGPDKAYASAKAIATRTLGWARFHVNGQYTFGSTPSPNAAGTGDAASAGSGAVELSRWLAGVAVDKTFPLNAMLITGEVFTRQPLQREEDVEWNAGAGVRYQLNPHFAVDAGLGKRLTGDDQSWFVTFGLARAFAIRALMPR